MSAIASLASLNASPAASTPTSSSRQALGRDDFLKLLMAQLRNQNPLEPQNGAEFAAQLAQFSSLEGINKLNQNFSDMLMLQGLSQGTNLIGKTVVYAKDAAGNTARGTVTAVRVEAGAVQIMIGNTAVGLNQIRSVEAPK